ncbi:MAG: OmpP1/FadL family transporter [Planctomycetaceae bacterium]
MQGKRVTGWLGGALASILLTNSALADALIRDGVGAISTGRGGTNIAFSDNGAVMLDNPAGIANFEGRWFGELSMDTHLIKITYADPDNYTHSSTQPFPVPEAALYWRSADRNWAAGVGFFAPAGFCASYQLNNADFGPGPHRYRSLGLYGKVLPGIAFHVTDELSIGASLGIGISRVELDAPFYLQTGPLAGTRALFDMSALGATPVWSIGMQYELSEQTTIGLAYNSEANFGLKGDLDAQLYGLGPAPLPVHFNARLAITWPQSLGIGIKHVLAEQHRVSADVIYYDWHSAFDNLSLTLTKSSVPFLEMLLGPMVQDQIPLNWKTSVSVRLGYEFLATALDTWRLGYAYHPSPVPNNTLNPLVDGVLEHAVSAGYTRRIDDWLISFAYQYTWGPTRYVGNSILVGNDFANSQFKAECHWISVALSRYF